MKRLQALRAKQAELKKAGSDLLDAADAAGRELTAEEESRFTAIETELKAVEVDITSAEQAAERRRAMAYDAPQPGSFALIQPGEYARVQVGADRTTLDPRQGFHSYADFARSVRNACMNLSMDQRLAAVPSATHREHGQDGYMVPPEFRDTIWELVWGADNMLAQVDSEPTNSNSVTENVDETTPWGTSGIKAYWRGEAQQMTATRQQTKPRTTVLHELYAFVAATDELLEDAPRLESRLSGKAAEAINYKVDEAIWSGDGNVKPMGIINANNAALISVAKETNQTATTFNATNAAKMLSRLLPQAVANASWWINSDVLPQLIVMTLGDAPIWTPPSSGLTGAPGGFLFGRPIKFSEHCATLGTVNDIILGDPKGYKALTKGGIKSASSIHLYFDLATTAFRHTFRMGGQPQLSAAISPKNGANTKGHFVVLATRS